MPATITSGIVNPRNDPEILAVVFILIQLVHGTTTVLLIPVLVLTFVMVGTPNVGNVAFPGSRLTVPVGVTISKFALALPGLEQEMLQI